MRGRKQNPRRKEFCERYGLTPRQMRSLSIGGMLLDQLDRCKSEAARRLLLGVSKKKGAKNAGQ